VLWSSAEVGGRRLREVPGWEAAREPALASEVRTAAAEIIRRKGVTNHAIGLVTAALLRWILRGERRVITVSRVHDGTLSPALDGVALSLPTIVGKDGATDVIAPDMDETEQAALVASAQALRRARASV
jgi:L-lactate dehydrogenase